MNLIDAAPLWLVGALALAMVAAAAEDASRFRISNLTVLGVLAGAVVAAVLRGPAWDLWQNLAVFAAVLALGTMAFSAGWMGGGDVKLFAAAGLWFDLRSAFSFVLLVLMCGGAVAIFYLLARPFRKAKEGGKRERRVPYGIAIALGAIAMILLNPATFDRGERPLPANKYIPYRG